LLFAEGLLGQSKEESERQERQIRNIIADGKKRICAEIAEPDNPHHLPESPQIGDSWHFAGCDDKYGLKDFPGRIPGQIVENLLHFYTEPFDLIVDPMGGSGTTKDVANAMYRRCVVSDINPVKDGIEKNNISAEDFLPSQKRCDFIFLDPPYFKKKNDEYAKKDDHADGSISSFEKDGYLKFFDDLAKKSIKALQPSGYLALVMSNFVDEDSANNSIWIWDYVDRFNHAGFTTIREIHCDLTTQSLHPAHVTQFKEEKRMAKITRSIVVFQKGLD
jgi:DNA modification methylase